MCQQGLRAPIGNPAPRGLTAPLDTPPFSRTRHTIRQARTTCHSSKMQNRRGTHPIRRMDAASVLARCGAGFGSTRGENKRFVIPFSNDLATSPNSWYNYVEKMVAADKILIPQRCKSIISFKKSQKSKTAVVFRHQSWYNILFSTQEALRWKRMTLKSNFPLGLRLR